MSPTLPPPLVADALAHGNIILAIKLLRDQTGMDLGSAKRQVDRWMQEGAAQTVSAALSRHGSAPAAHGGGFRADALPPAAVLAVGQGNPIQAIKLTREHHPGLSLAEAKAMVEDYRDRHPLQVGTRPTVASGDRPGGIWLWGVLALLLAGVALAWLLRG